MVWAGLTTSFAGLEWLLVCSRQPHMLIKIVQGRGAGCAKAQQPNCPCLWQERAHFRSRRRYIDREISPEKSFFFFLPLNFRENTGIHLLIGVEVYFQVGPRGRFAVS